MHSQKKHSNQNQKIRKKKKAEKWGRFAEQYAILYLTLKGYQLIAHRSRTKFGELDLIMKKKECLVFFEIKARKNKKQITETLSYRQKVRILNSAKYWLSMRPSLTSFFIRFDAIFVSKWGWITHVSNAFQLDLI